jgi:hypothetical protein
MSDTTNQSLESLFPNVDLKYILKDHHEYYTLINKIISYIKLIPNYNDLKLEPELTKIIINIIEDEIKNKDVDKTDLVVKCLTAVFGLTDLDQKVITQQIKFLQNNKMIIGIPLSKKYIKSATRWITRKIG